MAHHFLHVSYQNGTLQFQEENCYESRGKNTIKLIQDAFNSLSENERLSLQDFKTKLFLGDYEAQPLSLCSTTQNDLTIPDYIFNGWPELGMADYEAICQTMATNSKTKPIYDVAFWIGNAAGHPTRRQFVDTHKDSKQVLAIDGGDSRFNKKFISLPYHTQYRFLVDIQGHGYSGRVKFLLHSGRPLFYLDRQLHEYWFFSLKPFVHYIPVKEDSSDFDEKLKWAINNPEKAQKIADNALEFAQRNLRRANAIDRYKQILLTLGNAAPYFQNFFSKVFCLSIHERADRREQFLNEPAIKNWPLKKPEFFMSDKAKKEDVPPELFQKNFGYRFTTGFFGCTSNHIKMCKIAMDAEAKGENAILIMEDDVTFVDNFKPQIIQFLTNVPADWDGILIGAVDAQFKPVATGVGQLSYGGGSHCYAVRGELLKEYYEGMSRWDDVSDRCLLKLMKKYKVYCPIPILARQRPGFSDGEEAVCNHEPSYFKPESKPQNKIMTTPKPTQNTSCIVAGISAYGPALIRWLFTLRSVYNDQINLILTDHPEMTQLLEKVFNIKIVTDQNSLPFDLYLRDLESRNPDTTIITSDVETTVFQTNPNEVNATSLILNPEEKNFQVKDGVFINSNGLPFASVHDIPDQKPDQSLLNRHYPIQKYQLVEKRMVRGDHLGRPILGISITTRNRWVELLVCLQSILSSNLMPDIIGIWVDGDPAPKEMEQTYTYIINSFLRLGCFVPFFPGLKGQTKNQEMARQVMPCDLLYRLDDDSAIYPTTLEILLDQFHDPKVGACGGLILNPLTATGMSPDASTKIEDVLLYKPNRQWFLHDGPPYESDHLHGNYMYRKNIDVPYCDKLSPKCFREETIHTYQIKCKGYRLLIVPESISEHRQASTGGYRDKELADKAAENCRHDDAILRSIMEANGVILKSEPKADNNFFSEVICISLKRLTERREQFLKAVQDAKWPFVQPEFFDAVDGEELGLLPEGWDHKGQFGCAMSHRTVLRHVLNNESQKKRPILIMEDDAIFCDDFRTKVETFLKEVPEDWEGLMISGRHPHAPLPVKEGVGRCQYTTGTGCYCLRGNLLLDFFKLISDPKNHSPIDLILAKIIRNYKAYCPLPALAGQRAHVSDIDGSDYKEDLW